MNPLGFLMGGSKSAERVLDASLSGLDKLVFTEEEKADYHKKSQEIYLEFVRLQGTESSTSSISRRLICLPVVYGWIGLIFTGVWLDVMDMSTEMVAQGVEALTYPSLAAIGFYVGRHVVGSLKDKGE